MLNNREWAVLAWFAVLAVWLLWRREVRSSLIAVARAGASPKLLLPLLALFGYVALEVWAAAQVSLWRGDLSKDTVVWLITSGLVLVFNFQKASKEARFFRREVRAAFGAAVLVEFFINLSTLPLIGELILQPFVALVVMTSAVAGMSVEHRQTRKVLDGLLALIGVVMLIYTISDLAGRWSDLDKNLLVRQLALPIWLAVGLLPFVYAISLYANYELVFAGVDWGTANKRARRRAKLALISSLHFRARDSDAISWVQARRLTEAASLREARRMIEGFQQERRAAEQAVVDAEERLQRYAGSDDVDEEGRRLDRREFRETTQALRWLANSQMGWHQNQGEHYYGDLLQRFRDDHFERFGLPDPSGIMMEVSGDEQAWYAWRRTVTGWCFAIGAAGPPPNQWEYDGPQPPSGFPGQDPCWGSDPFSGEANQNWD